MQADLPQRWWRMEAAPLAVVLSLCAMFFLAYFNRFVGLRSGAGEFGGGIAWLDNIRPYRDYYTAGPPLNEIKAALELAVFGKALIVSHLCAVIERLIIGVLLYEWLRRMFTRWAAALAALVTIIVSAGDRTDPLASYNHDAIFLAMLCGFAACCSLGAVERKRLVLLATLAGVAAGLSSLTKQTVGLGTLLAVFVLGAVAVWRLQSVRRAAGWCAAYISGFVVPLGVVAFVLHHSGSLHACLQMLFVTGPAAKAGNHSTFFSRDLFVLRSDARWVLLAVVAGLFSLPAIGRAVEAIRDERDERNQFKKRHWFGLLAAGVCVVGVAEGFARTNRPALVNVSKSAVVYTVLAMTALGIACLVRGLMPRTNTLRTWQLAIFAGVGWTVAMTLSLSWPLFEAMALPGLALPLAAAVDGSRRVGRTLIYVAMAALVFFQVREKLDVPFGFHRENEAAVRFATVTSQQPMLRGMRLPPAMVHLLDETTAAMHTYARPNESVFTYPEMGLLYTLSEHQPPTLSPSHNIDVVPDDFARAEAQRLLAAKPVVVLYARPTEATMQADEDIWRGGYPSGQRDIVRALDDITRNYKLLDTFQLTPDDMPIRLYVRGPVPPPEMSENEVH